MGRPEGKVNNAIRPRKYQIWLRSFCNHVGLVNCTLAEKKCHRSVYLLHEPSGTVGTFACLFVCVAPLCISRVEVNSEGILAKMIYRVRCPGIRSRACTKCDKFRKGFVSALPPVQLALPGGESCVGIAAAS